MDIREYVHKGLDIFIQKHADLVEQSKSAGERELAQSIVDYYQGVKMLVQNDQLKQAVLDLDENIKYWEGFKGSTAWEWASIFISFNLELIQYLHLLQGRKN